MPTEAAFVLPPSLTRAERADLRREVVRQAWPVVLQNLLHMLMFFVDTKMVSALGKEPLAAMGVVGPVAHTITSVLSALSVGTVAVVARAWGEGDRAKLEREASSSLAVGLVVGLPLSIVGVLLLPAIAGLFQVPGAPEVLGMARGFLRYQGASLVFLCVYIAATGVLRAAGRTAFATVATLLANVLNVFLNWMFLYGNLGAPRMGMPGSSLATALALAFECALVLAYLWSPWSPVRISAASFRAVTRESLSRLIRVSVPAAIEPVILQSGFLVYNKAITLLGTTAMAAHRAAITIESLTFMPGWGFAVAGSAIVGQFLGAGRPDKADAGLRECARMSTYLMSAIGVVFLFAATPLVRLFLNGPGAETAVSLAALCLAISAFEQPFLALSMALGGALRGAGDTRSPVLVAVAGVWGVRVPLAWLLAFPMGLGITGIWMTMILDWAVRTAVFALLYRRGRWKSIKL
jgi:MATE family, multidrug efflux pump